MAITAKHGKRIKRNDRRWYDGLQKSSERSNGDMDAAIEIPQKERRS